MVTLVEFTEPVSDDDDESLSEGEYSEREEVEVEPPRKKWKAPSLPFCKVCKKYGYDGWFNSLDTCIVCQMRPCLSCKMPGHTAETCPHQVPDKKTRNALKYAFRRQISPWRIPPVTAIKPAYVIPDQVSRESIKYHTNQVTCLEFHPTKNNILLSGDMDGQLVAWDFCKVDEPVRYGSHSSNLNNMKFKPTNDGIVYAASSDGTVSCTDLETGDILSMEFNTSCNERQLYGMDMNTEKGAILVADNYGYLYMLDLRSNDVRTKPVLIHERGTRVVGLHCNPAHPNLLLSCGNDHFARIWDIRRMKDVSSIFDLPHNDLINSAFFSPVSGSKVLTTSLDNRLSIWDSIFGNMNTPSREIVHSHGISNMYPHRAEWDPKDSFESLAVIGRFVGASNALQTIDYIDVGTGKLVAEIINPKITTVSPINKLHPRDDVLASSSARSVTIWRPEKKIFICDRDENQSRKRKVRGESDDSDDDKSNPNSPK